MGPDQTDQFLYWLKCSMESLENRTFRPGQCLILAGPSGCGKTLLQRLITIMFGGRVAKPYRYMSGKTAFNGDLAGCEHMMISDESGAIDIKSRREFGENIKSEVANPETSIHPKFGEAITLALWHRLTISLNNQAESMQILPPFNDSLIDKFVALLCSRAELGDDYAANWSAATGELPALLAYLRRLRIPKQFRDSRYGVRAFINSDLADMMSCYAPEDALLELIDQVLFTGELDFWFGSATELEKELRESKYRFRMDKLMSYTSACGSYLGRLAPRFPERITCTKSKGKTTWRILKSKEGEE